MGATPYGFKSRAQHQYNDTAMVELVVSPDSESGLFGGVGSNPTRGTTIVCWLVELYSVWVEVSDVQRKV